MKYAILFAATAAASDAYGGYGGSKPSSHAPVVTPCSTTIGKNGHTTVVPGYGKTPVTVTSQYQAYPTCVSAGYDGKSCNKWEENKYVSTTITDYNKKVVTITKVQDYVTVYHEKKTVTHYPTPVGGYGAAPTPAKNATGVWYELYEKVHAVEYENMGKNALYGYSGSGLCQKCDDYQPILVKEYKGGKWTEKKETMNYGKPKDDVKVYGKPGVYTIPAKDVIVYKTQPGKAPEPVVYHYDVKTITVTKENEPYTCTYEAPKPYKTPSKGEEYPSHSTKTPVYNDYGYKAIATPKKPEHEKPSYPVYPGGKYNGVSSAYGTGYVAKPTPTPYSASKPVYGDNGKDAKSTPCASSTPAYGNYKPAPTPYSASKPVYGDNGKDAKSTPCASSTPAYGNYKPTPTPYNPVYGDNTKPSPSPYPSKPVYNNNSKPSYPATPSKPAYDNSKDHPAYPAAPSYDNKGDNKDHPAPPAYPAGPAYPAKPEHPTTPEQPKAPAYPAGGKDNNAYGNSYNAYSKRSNMSERRKAAIKV
jgi:hypothetical protein